MRRVGEEPFCTTEASPGGRHARDENLRGRALDRLQQEFERRGKSHIPEFFWWLSLSGATLLLVYFTLRGEPVGMLGQSVGWLVYSRNLYLFRAKHNGVAVEPE